MSGLIVRCPWSKGEHYHRYHDEEWGVPLHDDRQLFEMIVLEGAQAGLSWETILKKREGYREAFDHFDAEKIAAYDDAKIARLLQNSAIIRNRLKIQAAIRNAQAYLELRKQEGSLDKFLWQFTGGKPRVNTFQSTKEIPVKTPESEAMSKALLKRGFKFVGATTCYAFMQATGMVNDHLTTCFRWSEVGR